VGIAVGANFLLWPSREPDLVATEAKKAIAAHGAYAETCFSLLLDEATEDQLDQARQAAGVSSNALEALITRALLEPGQQDQDPLEAALVIDAALRRYAGRLATLRHDPALAASVSREALRTWRDWIADSMRRLTAGGTDLTSRPDPGKSDALGRIGRQIELMAGALQRLGQRSPQAEPARYTSAQRF